MRKLEGSWFFAVPPLYLFLKSFLLLLLIYIYKNSVKIRSWQSGYYKSMWFQDGVWYFGDWDYMATNRQACYNHRLIKDGRYFWYFWRSPVTPPTQSWPSFEVRSKFKIGSKTGFFPFCISKRAPLLVNHLRELPNYCWCSGEMAKQKF